MAKFALPSVRRNFYPGARRAGRRGPVWRNGRRKGLKIRWLEMAVRVRVPPPAPIRTACLTDLSSPSILGAEIPNASARKWLQTADELLARPRLLRSALSHSPL